MITEERPKLKLKLETTDIVLEILAWFSLAATWAILLLFYTDLPNKIPIHFNFLGKADAYGGKGNLFISPVLTTCSFILITVLNYYPHIFNYPVPITQNNALLQYTNATRMARYMKFISSFIFLLIEMETIKTALGQASGLGIWFLPLTLSLLFIPMYFFVKKAYRMK